MSRSTSITLSLLLCAVVAPACVLAPHGFEEERDRLSQRGAAYTDPVEERVLPEFPPLPSWHDCLERAFLSNGELEAAWFQWAAALERVTIAAGYPNTNLAPSFSYMVSGGGGKTWDRTTTSIGFDSMQNLSLPNKVAKAGAVAFDEARAAGRRFAATKFRIQRAVLDGFFDLTLAQEKLRIGRDSLTLARLGSDAVARRVQAGGAGSGLARAQVDAAQMENEVERLEADVRVRRAALNGLLARAPDAALDLSPTLPEPRAIPVDDARLLAVGVAENPELQALAFQVQGREDALELARLQYLPDFNPFVSFSGAVAQVVGVGIPLPTTISQIRAGVEAARAMLREEQAMSRQVRSDRSAAFVGALVALRDSEREATLFETRILPMARAALASTNPAYATGSASLLDLLDAERILLDVQWTIASARIEREKRLAEIEELAGVDIETLTATATLAVSDGDKDAAHE